MSFFTKHRSKIIIAAAVILLLAVTFFAGGDVSAPENTTLPTASPVQSTAAEPESTEQAEKKEEPVNSTQPAPGGEPQEAEADETTLPDERLTCTLSVRCDTILLNMDRLDSTKTGIVPADGVIFAEQEVTFYEGESVFNVLAREMKRNKIHLEFVNTPAYNSAYIEAIGNIYEFDCGELSGWMYRVNGTYPGFGSSQYQLSRGDKIEWVYTCNLGRDVGGEYSARNGKTNEEQ